MALGGGFEIALQVREKSPVAIGKSLSVMQDPLDADEEIGWAQTERATDTILASEDRQEGVAAFLERRSPEWRGR